ncbi:Protein phosphatase 2C 70 [Camellia lanceoleosa]|uniref:Protein phosphatase 2C 70 n=1 Tax=Camellia lanceoleosa TaxID=1840588 RepID=A0ACC0HBH5_9ERIC|nr:Protein phosphatase 2C 70 [Camellia lanceoleosa]
METDFEFGADSGKPSLVRMLPEMVASILSDSSRRQRVLSQCDASDVLRDAFLQTEGCTATVLLVWADGHENFYVQCANVGDSACVMNIDGKQQIKMSEDHRISSYSERLRMQETGEPLKDGETRLCGNFKIKIRIMPFDYLHMARLLLDLVIYKHNSAPIVGDIGQYKAELRARGELKRK